MQSSAFGQQPPPRLPWAAEVTWKLLWNNCSQFAHSAGPMQQAKFDHVMQLAKFDQVMSYPCKPQAPHVTRRRP